MARSTAGCGARTLAEARAPRVPRRARTRAGAGALGVDAARCVLYLERVPGLDGPGLRGRAAADPARAGPVLAAPRRRRRAAPRGRAPCTATSPPPRFRPPRRPPDVVLIDFGLAGASAQVEDRAAAAFSARAREPALASTHRDADGLVAGGAAAYAAAAADAKQVLRPPAPPRAAGSARRAAKKAAAARRDSGGGVATGASAAPRTGSRGARARALRRASRA